MELFNPIYYGSHAEELFQSLRTRGMKINNGASVIPLIIANGNLAASVDMMGFFGESNKNQAVLTKAAALASLLNSNRALDPHCSNINQEIIMYETVLRAGHCLFVDALYLDSSIGQWFIQRAQALGKVIWAIGSGTHNSPLASLYVDGIIYVKDVETLMGYVELSSALYKNRLPTV